MKQEENAVKKQTKAGKPVRRPPSKKATKRTCKDVINKYPYIKKQALKKTERKKAEPVHEKPNPDYFMRRMLENFRTYQVGGFRYFTGSGIPITRHEAVQRIREITK